MNIERIDSYRDERFSQTVLFQHGAYLINGLPYEAEITAPDTAVLRGAEHGAFSELIEAFRFHAPHITRFLDDSGRLLAAFPKSELLTVALGQIQPSQFFVDEEKLEAVGTFLRSGEDIVVQVLPWEGRWISLDGHTRLYWAVQRGITRVKAVETESDDWVWPFVREARKRGVFAPGDMLLLPHDEYEIRWNRYCDAVFAGDAAEP